MNDIDRKSISVIGLGYVGLVTAVGFGLKGHRIIGIDTNREVIEQINKSRSPIYETGITEAMESIRFNATWDYEEILDSDITFICVNTPLNGDSSIDLNNLMEVIKQIAKVLETKSNYHAIAIRSTIIPGTTEELVIPILRKSGDFGVCVNPEFMSEGRALYDFMNPSRIIIGEYDRASGDALYKIYKELHSPILRTDMKTAEMIKYASNAFLATKVSFINEIGNICKRLVIDVYQVAEGMGYDERIGNKFLNAGIGFGGSCLPKDTKALVAKAKEAGYTPRILEEVLQLNQKQPLELIELLKKHFPLQGKTIGLLGLAFKPETDDCRESLALPIVEALLREGATIKAHDPRAIPNFKRLFPQLDYTNLEELLTCDALLILTEWDEFKDLDFGGYTGVVIDGRRIAKASEARIYEGICW